MAGTPEHSITYASFPGERPILSGGRLISGWVEKNDGLWSVQLPEVRQGRWFFRQLFVSGNRQRRARDPNEGFFRIDAAGEDNRTSFRYSGSNIHSYANPGDAEIVFLHDWSISRVGIRNIDGRHRNSDFHRSDRLAGSQLLPHYGIRTPSALLRGACPELLDSPGEWYLDRREGVLSLLPQKGVDLNRVAVVAPVLEQLLIVRGDPESGRQVQNVRFVGLTFSHCAAPRFPSGYAGYPGRLSRNAVD